MMPLPARSRITSISYSFQPSKQVPEAHRLALAETIKERALAWAIVDIEPSEIDECGMTACLRKAFRQAVFGYSCNAQTGIRGENCDMG